MTANRYTRWCGASGIAALTATLAAVTVGGTASPVTADSGQSPPNAVIVEMAPGESIDSVDSLHGTRSIDWIPSLSAHLVTWDDARTADQVAAEIALDSDVDFAMPNISTGAPEVTFFGRIYAWASAPPGSDTTQWAANAIGLASAHNLSTGAGVTVAVIDTGIAASPTFDGVIEPGIDFIDGDSVPGDDRDGIDSNANGLTDEAAGHGTHVAGIVHLVAPDAHILPVRALDSDGNSDTFTVVQAMMWAADHGADVVNVSAGQTSSSTLLREAAEALWRRGVIVVGAAGNSASSRASYPAASKCAIDVTAANKLGALADYASYGSSVDVAAPGESIVSVFPYSDTGLASWSGTSMATPMVAGEVALLRSLRPDLRVGAIARLVVTNGVPLVKGIVDIGTLRRIDIAAAVHRARGYVRDTSDCLQ
jgi:subtilisin family serine protease